MWAQVFLLAQHDDTLLNKLSLTTSNDEITTVVSGNMHHEPRFSKALESQQRATTPSTATPRW
jgi:hypothetical protein